jgi:hypothetical protein
MQSILKKAGLAVAVGATALAMATPAQAQRWHRYHHDDGDEAAAAIVGGIIGLGIGAAIASADDDRYYDRYYYDRGYYAPPPRYSYRYRHRYYRPRCYVQNRWDPYYGRHVRVRICR